jgi:hypothetical protein
MVIVLETIDHASTTDIIKLQTPVTATTLQPPFNHEHFCASAKAELPLPGVDWVSIINVVCAWRDGWQARLQLEGRCVQSVPVLVQDEEKLYDDPPENVSEQPPSHPQQTLREGP